MSEQELSVDRVQGYIDARMGRPIPDRNPSQEYVVGYSAGQEARDASGCRDLVLTRERAVELLRAWEAVVR